MNVMELGIVNSMRGELSGVRAGCPVVLSSKKIKCTCDISNSALRDIRSSLTVTLRPSLRS
jgi:hypothetical protein